MPTLLQINTAINKGAVGTIVEHIGDLAAGHGWRSVVAHGPRYVADSRQECLRVNSLAGDILHGVGSLLFDRHGLGGKAATRRLCRQIKTRIRPDIIHLHNIHGYYVNYPELFRFIEAGDIPVVWTLHDCWAFTGHCTYYDSVGCDKWKSGCHDCRGLDIYPRALTDNSRSNYELKRRLFDSRPARTHIVAVSQWLANQVKDSFLKDCPLHVIHNGIDTDIFRPLKPVDESPKIILGVAGKWDSRKGLDDFVRLSKHIGDDYRIVLAGLGDRQRKGLPDNILAHGRIDSRESLAELYSRATVFVNLTREDSFPTVNLESLACGTPVVTYNTGGSPEAVDSDTGIVVDKGDIAGVVAAIEAISASDSRFKRPQCRRRAVEFFDKNTCLERYFNLYRSIIGEKSS